MRQVLLFFTIVVVSISFVFPQNVFAREHPTGSSKVNANPNLNSKVNANPNLNSKVNANPNLNSKVNATPPAEGAVLENPLDKSISSIPAFFNAIIEILMIFAIPFIVFFIIYAGFLYVTARGNAESIQKAHRALLYALIGGLLILGASLLLNIITGTVNDIVT